MTHQPADNYQTWIAQDEQSLAAINKRYNLLSYSRLVVFLLGVGLTYGLFQLHVGLGLAGGVAALLAFLYLIKRHSEVADKREHLQRRLSLMTNELKALAGEYFTFDQGKEWINPRHPYSYDMDLFGPGSIFQYINRTGTLSGRDRLAAWLLQPELTASRIRSRQKAVQELAEKTEWGLNFQALSLGEKEGPKDALALLSWATEPPKFSNRPYMRQLAIWLPVLFFLCLAGWLIPDIPGLRDTLGAYQIPGAAAGLVFLVQWVIVGANIKEVNRQHHQLGRKSRLLNKFGKLFQQIESQDWHTPLLQQQANTLQTDGKQAGEAISLLADLAYRFDQRLNAAAILFLNGALLWDIRYMLKLEAWRETYQASVDQWFEILAEWDAQLSLGRFCWHHPTFVFPTLEEEDFHLHAKDLGHPLIPHDTRVNNDMQLSKSGEFLIITGANMAGKSTFLRTVGVNLILGMSGAAVCAREMRFVPIDLITSVRATDSLSDHESYFFAELKQLKAIIDKLKAEGPTFVIVDEMLRGTNSKDKQTGSRKFIEQLISLKAVGMIATHDLSLGTLTEEYPAHAFNKRFEVEIAEDRLAFDYKLQDGISQNLNATFLMKQMGIMGE
ncbi:MAG: hypothetical protein AAF587_05420 [Bacteroidota bacterium]